MKNDAFRVIDYLHLFSLRKRCTNLEDHRLAYTPFHPCGDLVA